MVATEPVREMRQHQTDDALDQRASPKTYRLMSSPESADAASPYTHHLDITKH